MAQIIAAGQLRKMHTQLNEPVEYTLPVGDERIQMNSLLDKKVVLKYAGTIHCVNCDRKTSKSFNQGYCYPCFQTLAQCDSCIISPEKCHFAAGSCREPEWGQDHCMIDHFVYLANSSGVKVGITRGSQVPTRWIDQGAVQALPIFKVSDRLKSGLVEVIFKQHVADKTNWRKMLKGEVDDLDLISYRDELLGKTEGAIKTIQEEFGIQAVQMISDAEQVEIKYPVKEYPVKVTSFNFDKQGTVEGVLMGIKGQYLILDTGVINIRKFGGYHIEFSA